jgi:hypothetical protein
MVIQTALAFFYPTFFRKNERKLAHKIFSQKISARVLKDLFK